MKKLVFLILLPIYAPLALVMHFTYDSWAKLASPDFLGFLRKHFPFLLLPGHITTSPAKHANPGDGHSDRSEMDSRVTKWSGNLLFSILFPFMATGGFLMRETFEKWAKLWE